VGNRISGLTHLKSGAPVDASRAYVVSGWASVSETTQGPPVWDVLRRHVENVKTVRIGQNTAVKVTGT
jgi:S-sulfosulfanyl-L-cysteine sulfohydrolase